ncbi:MAG: 50S ribosomal protein L24 [Alphaproteobacteria bacterium]|nr:50S ribosomal protein L24 [Alphaproteobacteria bacterium]
MATKLKIKTKDKVVVLSGKDKGKTGEIIAVMPKENRVKVSGVNMIARHTKPSQANPQGGIVRRESTIHASNVALVDPKTKKATRAGYKDIKGVKTRIARRSGEEV